MRYLILLVLAGCPAIKTARPDADADGYNVDDDCDDASEAVNPAAPERCDGIDNDCDGVADDAASDAVIRYLDGDGDGYGALESRACQEAPDLVDIAGDCDDDNPAVSPGGTETCNGLDDDCDGQLDEEGTGTLLYADIDGDSYGDESRVREGCSALTGESAVAGDCDDTDAAVHPDQLDDCDEVDSDCDGETDEDHPPSTWYYDGDNDGWGAPAPRLQLCEAPDGWVTAMGDCDDSAPTAYPGAVETCDGVDQDCDGSVDEDAAGGVSGWPDLDGDGYGDGNAAAVTLCGSSAGYATNTEDCDDRSAAISPAGVEVCDTVDNDCSGLADDSPVDALAIYADADGDGYGDDGATGFGCADAGWATSPGDCLDTDAGIHPAANERCNGADDNCDGVTDTDAVDIGEWYVDADRDGYGGGSPRFACTAGITEVGTAGDCDDTAYEISPAATELCNGYDDNCDGLVDDDDPTLTEFLRWYQDLDGDGYGTGSARLACEGHLDEAGADGDCNDTDASISPGQAEICDPSNLDEDCDGLSNDFDPSLSDPATWYRDTDGDGAGDAASTIQTCEAVSGYVASGGDCDDTNTAMYPGNSEYCDGLDNDCDSGTSETGLASAGTTNHSSISAAIAGAGSGGTVSVCGGTWAESLTISDAVSLVGIGVPEIYVPGGGSGATLVVTGGTVTLTGLRLTGGAGTDYNGDSATEGGNLLVLGGTVNAHNVLLNSGYSAVGGGAAVISPGSAQFDGCEFTLNAAGDGGALYVGSQAQVTLVDSTFHNNSADNNGGAVYLGPQAELTVNGDTYTSNYAAADGGAIYVGPDAVADVTDTEFSDNEAAYAGAALAAVSPTHLAVSGSYFSGGLSFTGGAAYVQATVATTISGSVFDSNTAYEEGGALFFDGADLILDTNSFTSNAALDGGAFFLGDNTVANLLSNSFTANSASRSGGAAYFNAASGVTDEGTVYQGNIASNGAGWYLGNSSLVLAASVTLSGNLSSSTGGACYLERGAELYAEDSAFYGNSAAYYGGAFYMESSSQLTLDNTELGGGTQEDNAPEDVYGVWFGPYSWTGVTSISCYFSC